MLLRNWWVSHKKACIPRDSVLVRVLDLCPSPFSRILCHNGHQENQIVHVIGDLLLPYRGRKHLRRLAHVVDRHRVLGHHPRKSLTTAYSAKGCGCVEVVQTICVIDVLTSLLDENLVATTHLLVEDRFELNLLHGTPLLVWTNLPGRRIGDISRSSNRRDQPSLSSSELCACCS